MIQVRLLDPTDYGRLPIDLQPSDNNRVVILEDDETKELKGYWVAQNVVHCEPLWIAEDLRGSISTLKLFAGMLAALAQNGVQAFYCFSDKDENDDYLQRLGLELQPYTTYLGTVPSLPIKHQE